MNKLELHLTQALENVKATIISPSLDRDDMVYMIASDALCRAEDLAPAATSLQHYINEHRAELETVLSEFHQETNFSDDNLELWIMNDQALYFQALSAGVEGI